MFSFTLTAVLDGLDGGLFGVSKKALCFFSHKFKYFAETVEGESEGTTGVLTSPYFGVDNYPSNLNFNRTIQVEKGKMVKIHFTDFNVEPCPGGGCDYVTITEGDGSTLAHIDPNTPSFGLKNIAGDIVSKTDTVHVFFRTDSDYESGGWRLTWGKYKSAFLPLQLTEILFRNC